ncbi:MAG: DUF4276 family protein, partial [Planctomycetaceae bacterium]|nr:DUF4276 family protein [Planctomycetaceae bacterium]
NPRARFVVLRDNDGAPCSELKKRLSEKCPSNRRSLIKIRLVMQMLEAWLLGDPLAVEKAYGVKRQILNRRKFRDPDALANASEELKKLVPGYQKVSGAREIAKHMKIQQNKSRSFKVFWEGLEALVATIVGGQGPEEEE